VAEPTAAAGAATSAAKAGRWVRRRDPARNLLRGLKRELRRSPQLDADCSARTDLHKQIAGQRSDPGFNRALEGFVARGDEEALAAIRVHLDDHLDTSQLGVGREVVLDEVLAILRSQLGQAQRSPSAASDANTGQLRDHLDQVEDLIEEQHKEVMATLSPTGETGPVYRFLDADWAPQGARRSLERLAAADAELLARLQAQVGDPAELGRVLELVESWPVWVEEGPPELLIALARLIEQRGEWGRSTKIWERAAVKHEGPKRAELYVRAAVSADLAGDGARHDELLAEAREIDPENPRLLLEQITQHDDVVVQLAVLDRVRTDDPELQALALLQRSIASLIGGDPAAARRLVEEAEAKAPEMLQVKLARLNVDVHEGRIAVGNDRPIDGPRLEESADRARALRRELIAQRRFEESGRVLMLGIDASLMTSQRERAGELITEVAEEELGAMEGAEVLAEAAIRAGRAAEARRFAATAPETPISRRLVLYATALSGASEEVEEARAGLVEMLGDEEEGVSAAASLVLLSVDKPQLGWSEEGERVLIENGMAKVAIGSHAIYLAEKNDHRGAMALLEPYRSERWALEAEIRVTKLWGNRAERAAAANRLLARGPDQPMVVECGQALAAAGEYQRAAEVLVSIASNLSSPRRVRGTAYALLMHVVGRDLGEWERVGELLDDWEKAMPGDARIGSWRVALAANR
jgi:tetratricopeptide (TPR) repeat protein